MSKESVRTNKNNKNNGKDKNGNKIDLKNGKESKLFSASRLRSRNHVIDNWLNEEDGSDAYADLEDFLVE